MEYCTTHIIKETKNVKLKAGHMAKWPKSVEECELSVEIPFMALALGWISWLSAMWHRHITFRSQGILQMI